jgi:hypothetical protein
MYRIETNFENKSKAFKVCFNKIAYMYKYIHTKIKKSMCCMHNITTIIIIIFSMHIINLIVN